MARTLAAALAACCVVVGSAAAPSAARAQRWNDAPTMALVRRAIARRAVQLADTSLGDYAATAHGYLTFLAQLGSGLRAPPRVVRTDQLALQVYWRAPGLSKQVIVGRRDTLLLPTDIRYHRDHLGIVQNNFPDIIRFGGGDEVRDAPHPLSPAGLALYDFAIHDSLAIHLPDRTLHVYEVRVRPRDTRRAGIIGALYIDRASAQVVRMAFDFTAASYRDPALKDISVVLENALVDGRYWLPRRQEIEIRRGGTWLHFPARGIIRAQWEICCYRINIPIAPSFFAGSEIVSEPPAVLARYRWHGGILDSLPTGTVAATDADLRAVQAEARSLVRAEALERGRGLALAARRLSDFARVNRVEGLALGAGAAARIGGARGSLIARWGFADHALKARAGVDIVRGRGAGLGLFAEREYRDAGDIRERSLIVNSLAAQEYGADATDPYDVRAAGITADLGSHAGARWRAALSYESQGRLQVHATPFAGRYAATLPAWPLHEGRLSIAAERAAPASPVHTNVSWRADVREGWFAGRDTALALSHPRFLRAFVEGEVQRPLGAQHRQRLVVRASAGAVGGTSVVPPQEYVMLGGPVSAPGYGYHEFAAHFGASARGEWRFDVPFLSVPLGPYGNAPATATLAPYLNAVYVDRSAPFAPMPRAEGWYPSAGMGVILFFGLVRFDVARGLRGGAWTFSVDLARPLWGVL